MRPALLWFLRRRWLRLGALRKRHAGRGVNPRLAGLLLLLLHLQLPLLHLLQHLLRSFYPRLLRRSRLLFRLGRGLVGSIVGGVIGGIGIGSFRRSVRNLGRRSRVISLSRGRIRCVRSGL